MKSIILSCAVSLLLAPAGLPAAAAADGAPPISGKAAFEIMKGLAGEWTGKAEGAESAPAITVLYHVTAAQSAVVETLFPGTAHEMVTVYHLDRDKLVLTHYCAAGNQPHLALTKKSTADDLLFDFVNGANINPRKDFHMHSAHFHVLGADTLTAEWTGFKEGKPGHVEKLTLTRKKA